MKVINKFEDDLINKYIDCATQLVKDRYLTLDVCITSDCKFSTNRSKAKLIKMLSLSYYELLANLKAEDYFKYLTDDEKLLYMRKQTSHYVNDDFVHYNINELMTSWMFAQFENSLKEQLTMLIKQYYEKFKNSTAFTYIIEQAKQTYVESYGYKVKITTEANDLLTKIQALDKFVNTKKFTTLNTTQQELLEEQLTHMKRYYNCLKLRIKNLEENLND